MLQLDCLDDRCGRQTGMWLGWLLRRTHGLGLPPAGGVNTLRTAGNKVKWQEVENVIFTGSVKYVTPRFHHGFSGGGGAYHQKTGKVAGHSFCMIVQLLTVLEVLCWTEM